MKCARLMWIANVLGFYVVQLAAQSQHGAESGTRYVITNLGTFGGSSGSSASGVNNKGLVTGYEALQNGNQHAFMWKNGHKTDLGTLGGPESGISTSANEKGVLVGQANTGFKDPLKENFCGFNRPNQFLCLPVIWQDGEISPLPTLGGNNGETTGINNRGQVVGYAETAVQDPNCIAPQILDVEAALWEPAKGEVVELPPLAGDVVGGALAINDNSQIVGTSGPNCGPPGPAIAAHIVLWENGTPTDIGNLGGTMNNSALAINNRGQVSGVSGLAGDTTFHAFLWQDGVMTDLGTLPGDFASIGFGINNQGQVVGQSCDVNFNCRAFLWENGVMTDLNSLVAGHSDLYLLAGESINSHGEIAGQAINPRTGAVPAFLAVPVRREGD